MCNRIKVCPPYLPHASSEESHLLMEMGEQKVTKIMINDDKKRYINEEKIALRES